MGRGALSLTGSVGLVALWSLAIAVGDSPILPGPLAVALGIVDLSKRGWLVKHVVASLFRVRPATTKPLSRKM